MGRKSRRNTKETELVIQNCQEIFPTAIYARLSVENSGKDDGGAAISNQIEICKEYIEECSELQLVKVYEDNGWTGTVMHRPAFDEMMEDVRKGLVKAIIVRDLSRFGRNYIETGTYLEKIFPRLDVRFISVKERYDTFKNRCNESLMVPLQNLINDLYSKDISRKIEAAFSVQMKEGTFSWRRLPYGYCWDKEHKNIIPNEVTAPIVRNIFQWSVDGMSHGKIAEKLDELGVPTICSEDEKEQKWWSASTVSFILSNPVYIGKRVYGCRHSAIYKGIKGEKVPQEEWYIIENAHEPLVTMEIYSRVKEQMLYNIKKRQDSMEKTSSARACLIDLFENKIFCADCGYRMYFHRHQTGRKNKRWCAVYNCSSSQKRKHLGCSYHRIIQESLNEKVLAALRTQIKTALDYEAVIQKYKDSKTDRDIRKRMDNKIRETSRKISTLQARKIRLYEDFTEGILDEMEYSYAKETYSKKYELLNKQFEELAAKREEYRRMVSPENKWIRMMKNIRGFSKLTQELVDMAIDRVLVYEGGDIEIVMKYQDVFEQTRDYVTKIQREGESLDGGIEDCNLH